MPEQVRIVALLPDEHEVRRGHEVRDERAPLGRARERIGADAVPAAVVAVVVTRSTAPRLTRGRDRRAQPRLDVAPTPRGHNSLVPDSPRRDVAVVLSGGGINGALLELGFLRRLSETALWPRVGWMYGTSAGALAGTMATLGPARRPRGLPARDPARGCVPPEADVAVPGRAARLHASGDDRRLGSARPPSSERRSPRPRSSSSSTRRT